MRLPHLAASSLAHLAFLAFVAFLAFLALPSLVACTGQMSSVGDAATDDAGATMPGSDAAVPSDAGAGAPDGGLTDTATTDAGSPPANPDASVPPGPCPTDPAIFFCDDFEGGSLPSDRYDLDERGSGEVAVVGEGPAASGRHALRARVGVTSGSRATVVPVGVFPIAGNHFFGRAWFRVTPSLPDVHAYLMEASGPGEDGPYRYRLDSNSGRLNSRYWSRAADAIQHGGFRKLSDRPASDTWICVEWEYDGDENRMRYFLDGVEDEAMRVTGEEDPVWLAPVFETFAIGLHSYQDTSEPVEVRWDDLALSTARIGCGPGPSDP